MAHCLLLMGVQERKNRPNDIITIVKEDTMAEETKKTSFKVVPPGKKKCIWMEAGVVSYKLCDNNYDCQTCSYDQGMQLKVSRERVNLPAPAPVAEPLPEQFTPTWVEQMMRLPADRRKCRYMLTGEVDRKICANAYECGNCSFDQMMQERFQPAELPAQERISVGGFDLAEGLYYHEGHTWARPEYGGRVRIGLDDFARKLVGRLSRLNVPGVGHAVKQGEAAVELQRDGSLARALAPVDGIVTQVNYDLLEDPGLLNESPYEKGWIFIVEPTRLRKNLKSLFFGEDARRYLEEERERLVARAHQETQIAADGGPSIDDVTRDLKEENWSRLVSEFLRC
jgi:glycine cleavage system H lipoate-binding protein